jgi:riboflavin synthase
MFTGIVEELGRVVEIGPNRLTLTGDVVLQDASIGDSIAVNGTCLTLVEQGGGKWVADVSDETWARTNLRDLAVGDPVNLERPVRVEDRLGGHVVQGHVDAVGVVVEPAPDLRVRMPAELMRYCVEKGSVTVDGVSLTAFDLDEDTFRVAVIPHTAAVTTLGTKGPGAKVNIEVDVIAKHLERLVAPYLASAGSAAGGRAG